MNKELQIFNFNDFELETLVDENKEVWFLASPLAKYLEYKNPAEAIRTNVDKEDIDKIYIPIKSNTYMFINESGLYSLILRSNKTEAKVFKKWISSEVLPTIRKTGSYLIQPKELSRLEILTMAIEAEKKVLLLESKIEEDKPKVELANDLLDSTGLTPIKLAAKELGIPPMTFFKMLRVDGIIDSHNIMYQRFINSGLGEIKVTTRNNKMFSSTLFTPKGLASLHKKYKDYTKN